MTGLDSTWNNGQDLPQLHCRYEVLCYSEHSRDVYKLEDDRSVTAPPPRGRPNVVNALPGDMAIDWKPGTIRCDVGLLAWPKMHRHRLNLRANYARTGRLTRR